MKLIVGLGNPGRQYEKTRHNIGFRVLDALRAQSPDRWGSFKKRGWRRVFDVKEALVAEETQAGRDQAVSWLVKPLAFMNASGKLIKRLIDCESVAIGDLLVICDDVNLVYGQIRIRARGSDGGHNGLKSLINELGTGDFARLRVGVGSKRSGEDLASFVLDEFTSEEEKIIPRIADEAARAAEAWTREPLEQVMNRFNRKWEETKGND